jgi:AraC-like DNA-binding protein
MGVSFYLTMAPPRLDAWFAAPLAVVMRWTPVVFGLMALVATLSQWPADLVERRRHLRVFILLAGSAYTLVMAAVRLTTPHGRLTDLSASLDVAALLAIVASVATSVLRLSTALLPEDPVAPGLSAKHPGTVRAPSPPAVGAGAADTSGADAQSALSTAAVSSASAPWTAVTHGHPVEAGTADASFPGVAPPDPEQDRLADALACAMSERHAYRQEDLGVASLAAQLGVAEYRLRRLINQRLGHRNFNAYVNGLRLDQARAALADPAQRQQPVLTIALDAGFGSIGPFNRAFKAATGLTPTEYRRLRSSETAIDTADDFPRRKPLADS